VYKSKHTGILEENGIKGLYSRQLNNIFLFFTLCAFIVSHKIRLNILCMMFKIIAFFIMCVELSFYSYVFVLLSYFF